MKYYTGGEIYRLGLIKNRDGKPYKHRSSLLNLLRRLDYVERPTKHGLAKCLSEEAIKKYNDSIRLDT